MIRFIAWCKTAGHVPIPFSESVVYAFINDEGSRPAPTFPRRHVIGCPSALACVVSKRVIGHAAKCYKEKQMLKQKPPIKVEHVKILENILQDKLKLKTQDKVAAGFFLWMIYARARFSDAQAASTIVEDVISTSTGPHGFIEAQVHRSKTSVSLERKTRYLPMTAPIKGVLPEDCHWGLQWMKAIKESKLPIGAGRPLLPAQTDSRQPVLPISTNSPGDGRILMRRAVFIELCAGSAKLSAACAARGMTALSIDHSSNRHRTRHHVMNLDLSDWQSWEILKTICINHKVVWVHIAPPCGTASRVRERQLSTGHHGPKPLRSSRYPEGFP